MGASIRVKAIPAMAVAAIVVTAFLAGAGQVMPPSGVQTGTVAVVEGTVERVAPEFVSVRTTDGVTQLFRLLEKTFVHGASPHDELIGLQKGTLVAIHYSGSGESATAQEVDRIDGNGLKITEGRVSSINRDRGEIKVRLDNGKSETFRLTNRAAQDAGRDLNNADHPRVIVYYTNTRGVKEVHYFRQK